MNTNKHKQEHINAKNKLHLKCFRRPPRDVYFLKKIQGENLCFLLEKKICKNDKSIPRIQVLVGNRGIFRNVQKNSAEINGGEKTKAVQN